ncbi:DUF2796 domain-containing protein [Spartinivicinus ruber]|uniref:DUF2796 domain-containing protein n=1 Tax=Spartinivicinus ruber TaxID=2683272 RepID=UPI0013D85EF5|nr:DUF2796 domain-containing protein [Spartinivicinus ruber]
MKLKCLVTAILASTIFNTSYAKDDHQQHGAHEHGHAQLNIAQEGGTVTMQFISPAANILGFEHHPKNEEQETQLEQAIQQLKKGDGLFGFPEAAKCELVSAKVETSIMDKDEDHHEGEDEHHEEASHTKESNHKEEHDDKESHSEFDVEYSFTCSQPAKFHQLQVHLFDAFKGIEEIRTQYIGEQGQQGYELTPKVSVFNLP